MDIKDKLDRLYDLRAATDALRLDFEDKRAKIIPADVRAALDELEAEYRGTADAAQENAAALEAEIKADVLAAGATVKGTGMSAIYSAGRVSWDTKALDGFAAAHPEIATFRKVGEPSVSFRVAK